MILKHFFVLCLFAQLILGCGVEDVSFSLTAFHEPSGDLSIQQDNPKSINLLGIKTKKISVPADTLTQDWILNTLFPAPLPDSSEVYNEWKNVSFWDCPTCTTDSFADRNNVEDATVPYVRFPFATNFTELISEMNYTDYKQNNFRLYSFSTAEENDGTGRFVGGVLGLAKFAFKNNKWDLVAFEPAVNYQGSFTRSGSPDTSVIFHKKNYFIEYGGVANGVSADDYWPLYADVFIYSDDLKQLFRFPNGICALNCEKGSVWTTTVNEISAEKSTTAIELVTEGELLQNAYWGGPFGCNEEVIAKLLTTNSWMRFEMRQTVHVLGMNSFQTEIQTTFYNNSGEVLHTSTETMNFTQTK